MKIGSTGKDKSIKQVTTIHGSYEKMLIERKKNLPNIEKSINELLEDYDGRSIAVIVIDEDENGDPTGSRAVITGVSSAESSIVLSKSLSENASDLLKTVVNHAAKSNDPYEMLQMLETLTKVAKKGFKED